MANVYGIPEEFDSKIPDVTMIVESLQAYETACEQFIAELTDWCKTYQPNEDQHKYVGKTIRIPHADGHAVYMVASLKPLDLIHVPLWDAWESPLANRLGKAEVKEMIKNQKRLKKMFG
jgi:hypothetical protein